MVGRSSPGLDIAAVEALEGAFQCEREWGQQLVQRFPVGTVWKLISLLSAVELALAGTSLYSAGRTVSFMVRHDEERPRLWAIHQFVRHDGSNPVLLVVRVDRYVYPTFPIFQVKMEQGPKDLIEMFVDEVGHKAAFDQVKQVVEREGWERWA